MIFRTKQGDTRKALKATLIDDDGEPIPLIDCDVRFKMGCLIDREIEIVDRVAGKVWVVLEAADVAQTGIYRAEFKVKHKDGRIETVPDQGYITVYIEGGTC